MSETSKEETLRDIVAGVTGKDVSTLALADDLTLKLGIDSLAGLRVLAAIEKRCGVRFPDERLGELRSLGAVLEFIDQQGKESS